MNKQPSKAKWPWWVSGALLALALFINWGLIREPYRNWDQDFNKIALNKHGDLFALSRYYQQQFPKLPQQAWRTWNSKEPYFDNERQHLLFINNSNALSQSQFNQLLSWVEQGNHVVMAIPRNDPALQDVEEQDDTDQNKDGQDSWSLDANAAEPSAKVAAWAGMTFPQRHRNWDKQPAPLQASCKPIVNDISRALSRINTQTQIDAQDGQTWQQQCARNLNTLVLPEGRTLLWLASDHAGFHIKPSPRLLWQSTSASGGHIARIQHGQGSVILVTSMAAFANPSDPRSLNSDLNRADHAYLASYLAQDKQAVWFINRVDAGMTSAPPLWKKLWQFSPAFCLSLLLLCALFIWRAAHRHGVIRQLNDHENRQLQHYLAAQGIFLWRQQSHQQLLSQLQQQLWQQWQQRIPGLSLLSREQQLTAITQISSAPADAIQLWLHALPAQPTSKQWLAYLQAHQQIRNAK